jgi:hypothetical protein
MPHDDISLIDPSSKYIQSKYPTGQPTLNFWRLLVYLIVLRKAKGTREVKEALRATRGEERRGVRRKESGGYTP